MITVTFYWTHELFPKFWTALVANRLGSGDLARPHPSTGAGAEEEAREATAGRVWVVSALGVGWARFPGPPGPANNGQFWKAAAGMQPGESGGGAAAAGGRGRGSAAASYLSR